MARENENNLMISEEEETKETESVSLSQELVGKRESQGTKNMTTNITKTVMKSVEVMFEGLTERMTKRMEDLMDSGRRVRTDDEESNRSEGARCKRRRNSGWVETEEGERGYMGEREDNNERSRSWALEAERARRDEQDHPGEEGDEEDRTYLAGRQGTSTPRRKTRRVESEERGIRGEGYAGKRRADPTGARAWLDNHVGFAPIGPGLPMMKVGDKFPFDGRTQKSYETFIGQFREYVEKYAEGPADKMAMLIDACQPGSIRAYLEGCQQIFYEERAYEAALEWLESLFGTGGANIDELWKRMKEGRRVGDGDTRSLAYLTMEVTELWKKLKKEGKAERSAEFKIIKLASARLPVSEALDFKMRSRMEEKDIGMRLGVSDFLEFIFELMREARMAETETARTRERLPRSVEEDQERRGQLQRSEKGDREYQREESRARTWGKHSCELCEGEHAMKRCPVLLRLNSKLRMDTVAYLGLCFSCLEKGHVATRCRRQTTCRVAGCEQIHATILHDDRRSRGSANGEGRRENHKVTERSEMGRRRTWREQPQRTAVRPGGERGGSERRGEPRPKDGNEKSEGGNDRVNNYAGTSRE